MSNANIALTLLLRDSFMLTFKFYSGRLSSGAKGI